MDSVKNWHRLKIAALTALVALSVWHFAFSFREAQRFNFAPDFQIFAETTAVFSQTGSLYPLVSDLKHFEPGAPIYKFPPLLAILIWPFVADGSVVPAVYNGHWIVQGLLFVAAALLCLWVSGLRRIWAFGFLLLLANYEPFFETLWRLQLETPILLLLVGCGWALRKRRDLIVGLLLGIAIMLKVYPIFLLAYFVFRRRWRTLAACGSCMALLLVLELLLIGAEEVGAYYFQILPYLLSEPAVTGSENVGVTRYLIEFTAISGAVAKRTVQIVMLLGLGILFGLLRRAKQRCAGSESWLEFGLFICLMLIVMPNSWVNYQLLLLIPLGGILGVLQRDGQEARRMLPFLALAILPLFFYQPCADPTVSWPCAQTPLFFGVAAWPREWHDLFVFLRGISAPLLLLIGMVLHYRGGDGRVRPTSYDEV